MMGIPSTLSPATYELLLSSTLLGGLRSVTLMRERNDRAILGDDGRDIDEAAESAPFLPEPGGAGSGGDIIPETREKIKIITNFELLMIT